MDTASNVSGTVREFHGSDSDEMYLAFIVTVSADILSK